MDFEPSIVVLTFSHFPGVVAAFEAKETDSEAKKPLIRMLNGIEAMNIIGYIPVIGVIVGIARMIFAAINFKGDSVGMQCLRGTLEIMGLGPLMIISDPIITPIAIRVFEDE